MVVKDLHECNYADIIDTFFTYAPVVDQITQEEKNNGGGILHKSHLIDACLDDIKDQNYDLLKERLNMIKQFESIIDIADYLKSLGYSGYLSKEV